MTVRRFEMAEMDALLGTKCEIVPCRADNFADVLIEQFNLFRFLECVAFFHVWSNPEDADVPA